MGTVNVYCFIGAQDKEDAKHAVNSFLEDWLEKEFYDGFEIQEGPGDIQLLSDFYDGYFTPLYAASQSLLQQLHEEAEKARKLGDRAGEAGALRRASDLLYENMCPAMPWFNIEGGDFFLPSDKQGWWASYGGFLLLEVSLPHVSGSPPYSLFVRLLFSRGDKTFYTSGRICCLLSGG